MSDIENKLRKTADIVNAIESLGCSVTAMSDTDKDEELLITELTVEVPEDSEIFEREEEEDDVKKSNHWCGRCGSGPMTEGGVKSHNTRLDDHPDEAIVYDHEPEEDELHPLKDVEEESDGDGGEDGAESEDDDGDSDEGEEDSEDDEEDGEPLRTDNEELDKEIDQTIARRKRVERKKKRFKDKGLPPHMPRELEPPREMDRADVTSLVQDCGSIDSVADELGWELEKTERLLDNLNLAYGLEKEEESDEPDGRGGEPNDSGKGKVQWTDLTSD